MCLDCNLKKHPQPEYIGEVETLDCIRCKKSTKFKSIFNRLSYDELKGHQCEDCSLIIFNAKDTCGGCGTVGTLWSKTGEVTRCSNCLAL